MILCQKAESDVTVVQRGINYPPLTREQKAQANKGQLPPRLHAHADMDVLTLLYQRKGTTLQLHSADLCSLSIEPLSSCTATSGQ